jgi:hypothetical protein
MKKTLPVLLSLATCLGAPAAHAHSVVGDRIFPATLAIDDPGVSDEMTLPQISRFKQAGEDGAPSVWQTAISGEFDKRLTEDFGVSVGGAWLDSQSVSGWDNVSAGAKYVFFKNAPHEIMLSAGVDWDIGGTGTKRVGAESFSTVTPALFFGKGMGDLPDAAPWLKPFAVTGTLGYALPTRNFSTDPATGDKARNAQAVEWGFTLQYSVPYLQQHVKDIGLGKPFSAAIPIVEFAFESPTGGDQTGHTTGTINPGILFMGEQMQLGLEAQLPLNRNSGSGIGYVVQAHFYLDNIFPATIGKPLW